MSDLKDIRPEKIMVDIDGKEMQVEFDFNALAYLEEKTGKNRFEFCSDLFSKKETAIKDDLYFVHAGLMRHNNITIEEVGRLKSFEGVIPKVMKAYSEIILPPEIYKEIHFEDTGGKKTQALTGLHGEKNIHWLCRFWAGLKKIFG